jgi:Ca2+-binding EF-hand superfamily protein
MIADGSELLMLILDPGIIGGLVLPVMGAIPDGAMVLFSGLGDNAQEELSVGVGTLAGSTVTLLTIPWMMCTFQGAVDINDGKPAYKSKTKLTRGLLKNLSTVGTVPTDEIASNAKLMMVTSILYLIIQAPSFYYLAKDNSKSKAADLSQQADDEHTWALAGFIISVISFLSYCVYQMRSSVNQSLQEQKMEQLKLDAHKKKFLSVQFLFAEKNKEVREREINLVLREQFKKYDVNGDGFIDETELRVMFAEKGIKLTKSECHNLMVEMDQHHTKDNKLSLEEYIKAMEIWLERHEDVGLGGSTAAVRRASTATGSKLHTPLLGADASSGPSSVVIENVKEGEEEEEEEEEDEEEEDEAKGRTKGEILRAALTSMVVGVLVVTLFSDPMVTVLGAISTTLSKAYGITIPPFYISFIVTPLASNASELISAIVFAKKKTQKR